MDEPQIVFDNVVKRFGDTVAVEEMNLTVGEGEFLAIMGSSGCGKTTTLRMLAGLEVPSEGEIRLNGERINELKPSERETPMVWQSLALFPFLNVVKNVEFGLRMRGMAATERTKKAREWLERMEILDLADRQIDQLSGGQKQRVALARALVTEPPVLLLDEPLSALDANLVVRMQGVLSRLQKELGITFIYVTHSQSEAFAMADRVVIMSHGLVEQIGTPRQVFREPASRFVAEFVGSNNILSGLVNAIDDTVLNVSTTLGTVHAQLPASLGINVGDEVQIIISADRIMLSDQPVDSVNCFKSQVISEEFVGTVITLLVETESGEELKVQKQQRELDRYSMSSETTIWVYWAADDVYTLPPASPHTRNE